MARLHVTTVKAAVAISLVGSVSLTACSSGKSSSTSSNGLSGKSPAQVLAMAKAAALAKGSMRWVEDVKIGGGIEHFVYVTDAGVTQGKQIITGSIGSGTELLVSAQMAYAKGDATFLAYNLQVPQDEATKYAGRWIAVPSSSSEYAGLAAGLTASPLPPRLAPSAPLRFTKPTTIDGKSVVGVSGAFDTPEREAGWSGTQVLYISTAAPYLPVELTQHGTMSNGVTITDANHTSRYGESVVVRAPANSIQISSIPG
jgi:hypothetical protein